MWCRHWEGRSGRLHSSSSVPRHLHLPRVEPRPAPPAMAAKAAKAKARGVVGVGVLRGVPIRALVGVLMVLSLAQIFLFTSLIGKDERAGEGSSGMHNLLNSFSSFSARSWTINPEGYVYLHHDVDGSGVTRWQNTLGEVMRLARAHGRTVIQPCVHDGFLVPCPGAGQPKHTVDCRKQKLGCHMPFETPDEHVGDVTDYFSAHYLKTYVPFVPYDVYTMELGTKLEPLGRSRYQWFRADCTHDGCPEPTCAPPWVTVAMDRGDAGGLPRKAGRDGGPNSGGISKKRRIVRPSGAMEDDTGSELQDEDTAALAAAAATAKAKALEERKREKKAEEAAKKTEVNIGSADRKEEVSRGDATKAGVEKVVEVVTKEEDQHRPVEGEEGDGGSVGIKDDLGGEVPVGNAETVSETVAGTPEEVEQEKEALEEAESKLAQAAEVLGMNVQAEFGKEDANDKEEEEDFDPAAAAAAATNSASSAGRRRLSSVSSIGQKLRAHGEVVGTDVWICRGSEYVTSVAVLSFWHRGRVDSRPLILTKGGLVRALNITEKILKGGLHEQGGADMDGSNVVEAGVAGAENMGLGQGAGFTPEHDEAIREGGVTTLVGATEEAVGTERDGDGVGVKETGYTTGGRTDTSTGAAVATATNGAAIRARIARAFLNHGDHENELMEEEPFLGPSLLHEDNKALLYAMQWAEGPLDEALAFVATKLRAPYIAFHWRSARVLGWNSADIADEDEMRRIEATAMWCASVFVRSVQRHVAERGYQSVVIISDVPASNGSFPLVPSRMKGDVDYRVLHMMSDAVKPAPFIKIDAAVGAADMKNRDRGVMAIVDHVIGEKADVLVTCMDAKDECAHCTDVDGSFATSMTVKRLIDHVPRSRTTIPRW